MRRKEKEVSDIRWQEDVLKKAEICRVGLTGNKYPYIVPVNYGYKDKVLYFHSATEGQKLEMIRENPNVCIQVDTSVHIQETDVPCDWSTTYKSVIAYGKASIVEDAKEKLEALSIIVRHYKTDFEEGYPFRGVDRLCIVRIDIEEMTGKQSV